jgi:hypothetical protein
MFTKERAQPGQEWTVFRAIDNAQFQATICVSNPTLDFVMMHLLDGQPNLLVEGTRAPNIKTDVDQDTHVLTLVGH